jgi:hypothetical protein
VLIAALAGLAAAVAAGPAASGPPQPSASFAQFVDTHCLDCHDGVRAKGGFDLAGIMPAGEAAQRDAAEAWMTAADPTLLRAMRARLARQDMPPANIDERPSAAEYAAMIAAIDAVVPPESREVPVVRRLNRWQIANSIRDTIGLIDAGGASMLTRSSSSTSGRAETGAAARGPTGSQRPDATPDVAARATFADSLRAIALDTLPADDVGEGFDTTASTLVLPPLLLEKFLIAAEHVADAAVLPPSLSTEQECAPGSLERRGQVGAQGDILVMATNGSLTGIVQVAHAGTYRLLATVSASRAGPELAKAQLLVDGSPVPSQALEALPRTPDGASDSGSDRASSRKPGPAKDRVPDRASPSESWTGTAATEIPFDRAAPGLLVWQGTLAPGPHRVGVAFLNDYYNPKEANPKARDRNLHLHTLRVIGPLEPTTPTPFQQWAERIAADGPTSQRLRRVATALASELFRRPVEDRDGATLARTAIDAAGGAKAPWDDQLRALVTAVLVDPRFLLRVEAPIAEGRSVRQLDGLELASRLSFFLWASVPDRELRDAAARGDLKRPGPLRAQIHRMLADPRAASLGQRFFTQWLGIDGLAARQFDPAVYPGLDARMLTLMEQETTALCGRVVRGELPPRALLETTASFASEELRAYYAQSSSGNPIGDATTSVNGGANRAANSKGPAVVGGVHRTDPRPAGPNAAPASLRPPGIFGHGSVLAATSNPTRTSPVKRGKWVLEALLDQAPPPPPPGVPQLPEGATNTEHRSIRELMAQHRANPDCASCHVRMDAIGLAFERFDATGRMRAEADGHAIDDTTELPGGEELHGVAGVAGLVAQGQAFERSLARRLFIYALGRGTADADDPLISSLAARVATDRSFESLVMGIAMSDAFQQRRAVGVVRGSQSSR